MVQPCAQMMVYPAQTVVPPQMLFYPPLSPESCTDSRIKVKQDSVSQNDIVEKLHASASKLKKDNKNLEGVKYDKVLVVNKNTNRVNTVLVCKYDNCGREFKKSWDLLDHVRQHTGEKPYSCEKCKKRFAQRGNLVKHRRLHRGEDSKAQATI